MKTIVVALMMVWCVSGTRAQWVLVSDQNAGIGGMDHVYSLFTHGTTVFAIVDSGLFESFDDGMIWRRFPRSDTLSVWELASFGNSVVGVGSGVWLTNDDGISWQRTSMIGGQSISDCATYGSRIICSTVWSGVKYSDDSGKTWKGCSVDIDTHVFGVA